MEQRRPSHKGNQEKGAVSAVKAKRKDDQEVRKSGFSLSEYRVLFRKMSCGLPNFRGKMETATVTIV